MLKISKRAKVGTTSFRCMTCGYVGFARYKLVMTKSLSIHICKCCAHNLAISNELKNKIRITFKTAVRVATCGVK